MFPGGEDCYRGFIDAAGGGYFVQGSATYFLLTFPNDNSTGGALSDAVFDYFVVDVAGEAQQHG